MNTVIPTPRLSLRPANQSDESFLVELRRRPEVLEFIGAMRAPETDTDRIFTILESNERVGVVGIVQSQALDGTDVALLCALTQSAEGGGRAEEACRAVIAWARSIGLWNRLLACVDDQNTRSRTLTRKLGFTWLTRRPFHNEDVFVLPLSR